ncbi:MAG TPA: hypothetical protein VFM34_01665 [Moraxellaceae bacterium]|nr:hypothetical protein [Moraxellaceae bacterium]
MADMTTPRLCVLLLALTGSATALGGTDTCRAVVREAPAGSLSDIDYVTINKALLTSDPTQRLIALTGELKKLDLAHAPEAPLVRHRLLMATAQTQATLGMDTAAMGNLKRLPVNSPVAPQALMFMADIEVKEGKPRAAVRWLRQLADLYPQESLTIHALWRAAELNHPHSRQALALWQEAARQADQALASAQSWRDRSQQPDFVDTVSSATLSPELWRLTRTTFTDPAFASADAAQASARQQLQCIGAGQSAQLAELNAKLGDSRARMQTLLQQRLTTAVQDWEQLAAEAHYRLADAQEPRIHPGIVTRD